MSLKVLLDKLYTWSKNSVVDEVLIFAVILVFVESYAQYQLKSDHAFSIKIIQGMIMYGFLGYILHYSYDKFPLSKMNITWSSMSIILAAVLGYLMYGETMNKNKIFAITFALLSVYFVSISE